MWWALNLEDREDEELEAVICRQKKQVYRGKGMEQTCEEKRA